MTIEAQTPIQGQPDPHDAVRAKLRTLKATAATNAQATSNAAPALPNVTATPVVHTSQPEAESSVKSLEDVRLEAAEMARVHWLKSRTPMRVMSYAAWVAVGEARAKQDGCTCIVGMKKEGWVHSYISETDPRQLHTHGAASTLELTKKQKAERALAWSRAKGISIVEAFTQLGVS